MKPYYKIYVYILTDHLGEWWEYYKKTGCLRMWDDDRQFHTESAAVTIAKALNRKLKVKRFDPPIKPSITWRETIVMEIDGN